MVAFQTTTAKSDVNSNWTIGSIETVSGLPKQPRVESVMTAAYSEI